jgi:hypothetical protein
MWATCRGACAPLASLFGLAPGGVCRAARVATRAVRSYRTISPLPLPLARHLGGIFLLHFPWAHAPQVLPGTLPDGARTFLHVLMHTATAWPTLGTAPYAGIRKCATNATTKPNRTLLFELQRTLVGFVVAHPQDLRGEPRRLLERQFGEQQFQDPIQFGAQRLMPPRRRSLDHEHDLAALRIRVTLRARAELGE